MHRVALVQINCNYCVCRGWRFESLPSAVSCKYIRITNVRKNGAPLFLSFLTLFLLLGHAEGEMKKDWQLGKLKIQLTLSLSCAERQATPSAKLLNCIIVLQENRTSSPPPSRTANQHLVGATRAPNSAQRTLFSRFAPYISYTAARA